MNKKFLTFFLILLIIGAMVWPHLQSESKLPAGFAVSNGRLELKRIDVATLYAGRVEKMLVDEGDEVEAGQILSELSSAQSRSRLAGAQAVEKQAQKAVERAEAEVNNQRHQQRLAQLEFDNARQMRRENLISATELKQRQSALNSARASVEAAVAAQAEAVAAVERAKADIEAAASADEDMRILSPKLGRIEYRLVDEGNVVGEGNNVVSLLDPTDVSMNIFLSTHEVSRLKIGDEARIVLDGVSAVFPATISFISKDAQFTPKSVETQDERANLVFKVKLKIPADVALKYRRLLKAGMRGNGFVRTDETQPWVQEWSISLPEIEM